MTFQIASGSPRLPRYITLINNSMVHSNDLANMIYDTNRHDSASMFMLILVCMSSCSVVEWWMSSWCIMASPPHDQVWKFLDGHWVHLMLHVHVAPLLVLWHAWHVRLFAKISPCMFAHPSISKHILSCSSVHLFTNTSSHGRPFTNTSPRVHRSLICLWTHPLACTLLVHPIHHRIMSVHVPVSAITHD